MKNQHRTRTNMPARGAGRPGRALIGPALLGLAAIVSVTGLTPTVPSVLAVPSAMAAPSVLAVPSAMAVPSAAAPAAARAAAVRVRDIRVGGNPYWIAADPKARAVWVAARSRLVRVSEATQRVVATLRIRSQLVAVDPAARAVWTWNYVTGTIEEISEATNKVVARIGGFSVVWSLAVDPRSHTVWVALSTLDQVTGTSVNSVTEISEATHGVVHAVRLRLSLRRVFGTITTDPRTKTVWVAIVDGDRNDAPARVDEIRESGHRVIHVYSDPGEDSIGIATDPARGTVWLALPGSPIGDIEVIRESAHRFVRSFGAPVSGELAIDSRAHVVVADGPGLVLLNELTDKVTTTIRAAGGGIAIDQATGQVYATGSARPGYIAEFRL